MIVSLQLSNDLHLNNGLYFQKNRLKLYIFIKIHHKESSLWNNSKVIIINEDDQNAFLIDYLLNRKTVSNNARVLFKYEKLEESNKTLNLFECCESLSNIFLTERNLTIITFKSNQSEDNVMNSVVRRLLKIMTKVNSNQIIYFIYI